MENLEKLLGKEADIRDICREAMFSEEFVSNLKKLGYKVNISDKAMPDIAYIENPNAKFHFGYNSKEGVFYFSISHKNGGLGDHPLLDQFNGVEYTVKKEGTKVIIKGNDRELRINHLKNGEKVEVICSYSAVRSVVVNEFMRFAKAYSESNFSSDK